MQNKILATVGAAALAFTMSGTANAQIISQPGESMGAALGAVLPEGVFFVDTESVGSRDTTNLKLNVNIPLVIWATPFTFYNSRLQIYYALPFTSTFSDNNNVANNAAAGALNRTDVYSQLFGPQIAHDFGNGLNAALLAGVRPQDNFTNAGRGTASDIRASVSYVKDGFNATLTFAYSGNFGGKNGAVAGAGFNDNTYVDYTFTKKFGKLELGVVGFAQTDINEGKELNAFGGSFIQRSVAVGGLIGYDFGKFTLQGMVTREVYGGPRNPALAVGYGLPGGLETRGWLRLIVPLYVAPTAPGPVVARY